MRPRDAAAACALGSVLPVEFSGASLMGLVSAWGSVSPRLWGVWTVQRTGFEVSRMCSHIGVQRVVKLSVLEKKSGSARRISVAAFGEPRRALLYRMTFRLCWLRFFQW